MSDSTYVAGKSQPVYFLNKLWEASIANQVTPEIEIDHVEKKIAKYYLQPRTIGKRLWIHRIYPKTSVGVIKVGRRWHCLYAELPHVYGSINR